MPDIPEEPRKSAADVAYTVAKAAVSAVAVVGGPAAEVLGLIFGPPLERRRGQWLEQLAGAVKEVQEKAAELTPEKLSQNEAFCLAANRARTRQLGAPGSAELTTALRRASSFSRK